MLRPVAPGGQAVLAQEINVVPAPAEPTRVLLSAWVRRGGAEVTPPQVSLKPGDGRSLTLVPTGAAIALDGGFHEVQWTALFPALPAAFSLEVVASSVAQSVVEWEIDSAELRMGLAPMQVIPSAATLGQEIQILHPALGPDWQAFIGGQATVIVDFAPGRLVCIVPPPPPGFSPHLFLPVRVTQLPAGPTFVDPAAFSYRLPVMIDAVSPAVASSAGGTRVQVAGQHFPTDLMLTGSGSSRKSPTRSAWTFRLAEPSPRILRKPPKRL